MEALLKRPTSQEQKMARDSLVPFTTALAHHRSEKITFQINESDKAITVPLKALELLSVILTSMAEGKAISLIPADSHITTQQAADLLKVSRPHVVKLLEQGQIPFQKVGTHRRILLEDLLQFETKQKSIRQSNLQFLADQAQELNLGYE